MAGGYAGITRPLDGVCFAIPVGVAILWQLRENFRMPAVHVALMILGASPFLLLLAVQNIGVTGHPFELAEAYYNRENFPASPMGFHQVNPQSDFSKFNATKRQWLEQWVIPSMQRHTPANAILSWYRGRLTKRWTMCCPIQFVLLLPVGILSHGRNSATAALCGFDLVLLICGHLSFWNIMSYRFCRR